jgi:DNA-binding CsgD family transcriptional regulator
LSRSLGIRPAPAALTHLGRCGDALELIDEALPAAREHEHPLTLATLLFTKAGALARMGDLEEARQLAEWCRDIAMSGGMSDATASFGVLLGGILLRQGRCASASRIFQDAAGLLAERDALGYRPWALAGLAGARAQAGEEEAATAALEEVRRTQPVTRHYDMTRFLAEIEVHSLMGRTSAAVDVARRAADWARTAGMPEDEAQAVDAWVRIAPSQALAERIAQVAELTDSKLVGLLADHAQALVARDPDLLLDISHRFATLPAWRLAATAASSACDIYDKRGKAKDANVAARAAEEYASHCEGGFRPSVPLPGPVKLSKREREIAQLAAEGRSSKEIAERMYLSRRTVESHLYHVYIKLGVSDRAALAGVLNASEAQPG